MPYLSDYKALLFDIDRTLVPPSRELFPEIPLLLKQLAEKNIVTGLCSGRGAPSIANVLFPLFPDTAVHVLAGGSLVMTNARTIVWQKNINATNVTELTTLALATQHIIVCMTADTLYSTGETLTHIQSHPWKQPGKDLATMNPESVGLMYIANPSAEIKEYLAKSEQLNYTYMVNNQGENYVDITAQGVNKATGLQHWSEYTGIAPEMIIGFGDSQNDTEFLQTCGFAVAMGNANQEIKDIADKTIGLVSEKGLPIYVQSIIEGKPL